MSDDTGTPKERLYIEGQQIEMSVDDVAAMARSIGGDVFVYQPTEADQKAAAARLAAQEQALLDASGTLPAVLLDFDPRHSRWADTPDPLWLLTPAEYEQVPDGSTLVSISGGRKVKGTDDIDQDTRFGCIAWGFLESQLIGSAS